MRKLAVAFLALALLLVGTVLPLVMPWHCRVNRATFERLKVGMTRAQVEAILGGPPGDYQTRPSVPPGEFDLARVTELSEQVWPTERWAGDQGDISVRFTPGGVVADVQFTAVAPYSPSPLELALWRLERMKERLLP
jgi:hypothetical protein